MDGRQPDDPDVGQDPSDGHVMPRWVKAFAAAGVALVVLVGLFLLLGSGEHGPGRHAPAGGSSEVEAPAGHTPPADAGHG